MTKDEILFAVKTWSKNHVERLPIIQQTWGADALHIRYFSDIQGKQYIFVANNSRPIISVSHKFLADSKIPTIKTNTENTDHGHCAKAVAIFKIIVDELNFNKNLAAIKWFVLADDDTLLR